MSQALPMYCRIILDQLFNTVNTDWQDTHIPMLVTAKNQSIYNYKHDKTESEVQLHKCT